jgi:hypothetical protein
MAPSAISVTPPEGMNTVELTASAVANKMGKVQADNKISPVVSVTPPATPPEGLEAAALTASDVAQLIEEIETDNLTPPAVSATSLDGVKTAELTASAVAHKIDAESELQPLDASKLKFTRTLTPMTVCSPIYSL